MVSIKKQIEKEFENRPFKSTRRYFEALDKKRKSLSHRYNIIHERDLNLSLLDSKDPQLTLTNSENKTIKTLDLIAKQIRALDAELKDYHPRWYSKWLP